MPDITLAVNGMKYGGWKSARISRSIEQLAAAFELGISENWKDSGGARPIKPGQSCQLNHNDIPLILGNVDDVEPEYDANSRAVTVRGRCLAGDLVDCSAEVRSWRNIPLLKIAEDLCSPYGINVIAAIDLPEKIKSHQVEPGETAFECLERAARMRGALLISTGAGAVEITRAGTDSIDTVLERGVNILAARGQLSHRDRFSEYTVLGQAAGDDSGFGVVASEPKGTAQDAGVSRTRPLTVLSESPGGLADMKTRAEWERAVRLGRSSQVVITVQGWEHSGGLWEPNTRVKVRDDWLGLDEELLLAGVSLVLDDNGSRAELTLTRPEAFDLLPVPEPYEGSSWE